MYNKITFLEYLKSNDLHTLNEYAKPTVQTAKKLSDLPFEIPSKVIGKGAQSKVYKHPTDYKTVIKVVDMDEGANPDVYISMIEMFANNHNPFFPRIYEVYDITDEKGDLLVIVMEELHRLNLMKMSIVHKQYFLNSLGLSKKLIFQDLVDIKNPDATKEQKAKAVNDLDDIWKRNKFNTIIDQYLNNLFEDSFWPTMLAKRSKNDEFIKAVKIIQKFKGALDIHSENLMFRLTSVGPHLVFSDPVY